MLSFVVTTVTTIFTHAHRGFIYARVLVLKLFIPVGHGGNRA